MHIQVLPRARAILIRTAGLRGPKTTFSFSNFLGIVELSNVIILTMIFIVAAGHRLNSAKGRGTQGRVQEMLRAVSRCFPLTPQRPADSTSCSQKQYVTVCMELCQLGKLT